MQDKTDDALELAKKQADGIMAMEESKLRKILKNRKSSELAKAKACQRLAVVGTKASVPVLAAMLDDPKFSHYARFGLEPIPDPSVDDAFRQALGRLKGRLRVGVINSLGQRKDPKAVAALVQLLDDPDVEVAVAAMAALGRIGGVEAAKALQKALEYTKTVASACLECSEGLLAQGMKEQALGLYESLLSRSDLPEAIRLAAVRGRESTR